VPTVIPACACPLGFPQPDLKPHPLLSLMRDMHYQVTKTPFYSGIYTHRCYELKGAFLLAGLTQAFSIRTVVRKFIVPNILHVRTLKIQKITTTISHMLTLHIFLLNLS